MDDFVRHRQPQAAVHRRAFHRQKRRHPPDREPAGTAPRARAGARQTGIGGYNTLREADGRFRMWYDGAVAGGLPSRGARRLCYAESDDGLHSQKPERLISFRGSRRNNIVASLLERQSMASPVMSNTVLLMKHSCYFSCLTLHGSESRLGSPPGICPLYRRSPSPDRNWSGVSRSAH